MAIGRAVLGIDAAWTSTHPSGVALVAEIGSTWSLAAVAQSYSHFHASGADRLLDDAKPLGSIPDAQALLSTCASIAGHGVDLVAIDMPLSRDAITGRRTSDNAVSRAYGARKCGTHTPSRERPGDISNDLRVSFENLGYRLMTLEIAPQGLIEVYPHPALVELTGAAERLPYKAQKAGRYWPSLSPPARADRLRAEWRRIVAHLDREIAGVASRVIVPPSCASGRDMKACEDMIDAIVCAWIGICALEGRALAFGDERSAIWIPRPTSMGMAPQTAQG